MAQGWQQGTSNCKKNYKETQASGESKGPLTEGSCPIASGQTPKSESEAATYPDPTCKVQIWEKEEMGKEEEIPLQ